MKNTSLTKVALFLVLLAFSSFAGFKGKINRIQCAHNDYGGVVYVQLVNVNGDVVKYETWRDWFVADLSDPYIVDVLLPLLISAKETGSDVDIETGSARLSNGYKLISKLYVER